MESGEKCDIKFGTDGWRGVISDNFTFYNVRVVAQALADYLHSTANCASPVVIGYDVRFLSDKFAYAFGEVIASNDIEVFYSREPITSPMLSFTTKKLNASVGVMLTASHNLPQFNGIKFKLPYGGPITNTIVSEIEKYLYKTPPRHDSAKINKNLHTADFLQPYIQHIVNLIPQKNISAKLKVAVDNMHGASSTVLNKLLRFYKSKFLLLNMSPDPLFGGSGRHPEPIPSNITHLSDVVKRDRCDVGVALDGDGDRIGVISPEGKFIIPAEVLSLILLYFVERKKAATGKKFSVAKTVSVSQLVDRICQHYGLRLYEVPVGFKNITELMIKDENVYIGGEESGGIGYRFHIPERDGIFTMLMLLELLTAYDKPLNTIIDNMRSKFGSYVYARKDIFYDSKERLTLINNFMGNIKKLQSSLQKMLAKSKSVAKVDTRDGVKIYFSDSSWLLIRPSYTEPVIRIYAEGKSKSETTKLINAGASVLFKKDLMKKCRTLHWFISS
jgi:alpha-D-glucose phosphate-specific phosphoglucomutase